MAEKPARAGIHRGNQLEACRKIGLTGSARDGDLAGLQRFTQHFQHLALEFGQLVQKKHAAMGERNLARPR
jgi:hypothetical protein